MSKETKKQDETSRHLPEHGPIDEKTGKEVLLSVRNVDIVFGTGLRAGHVTPFGILNSRGYPVVSVFDRCLEGDIVGVHPMSNDSTIFLKFDDVRKLIEDEGFKILMYDVE